MSTHSICFYGELTKIIIELSSNSLLICSPVAFLLVYIEREVQVPLIITKEGESHFYPFDPAQDNRMTCVPSEDSDQPSPCVLWVAKDPRQRTL